MEPTTQSDFFPVHGGQPSARASWSDLGVNSASNDFYADTLETADHALLRPRFDGYIKFQSGAAHIIRTALAAGQAEFQTLTELRTLWRCARDTARGDLDDNRI